MFGCAKQGGIRYTKKHNMVLLIDSKRSEYVDEVDRKRGYVIYNGTGEDDQSFDAKYSGAYNKKVRDADSALLYFRKPMPNQLVFMFPVKYLGHTYGRARNRDGRMRRVIRFKLKILDI
jgi:hypothetical protein